jgi:oxalate decarboxylase/phosphoglucose isomerase-like protein (cupin superfamily)
MRNSVFIGDVEPIQLKDHYVYHLLEAENGCLAGCSVCIGCYTGEQYPKSNGVHDDQEIFYVMEGTGSAMVGGEEIQLKPGVCFLVKPGQDHGLKKDKSSEYLKVMFIHSAV